MIIGNIKKICVMQKQKSTIIICLVGIIIGYILSSLFTSAPKFKENTFSTNEYQITLQDGWAHEYNISYNGDLFYKKSETSNPILTISKPVDGDQGACLTQISKEELVTKNGLSFTLTLSENQKGDQVKSAYCATAFNNDFFQVSIDNSLEKVMLYTYHPDDKDAMDELKTLLESIETKK